MGLKYKLSTGLLPEVTPETVSNTNDSVRRFRNLPRPNNPILLPSSLYAKLIVEIAVLLKHLHYISEKRGDKRSAQITNSLFLY